MFKQIPRWVKGSINPVVAVPAADYLLLNSQPSLSAVRHFGSGTF
jgi:hypothetical protein